MRPTKSEPSFGRAGGERVLFTCSQGGCAGFFELSMTTEEPLYAIDPRPPDIDIVSDAPVIRFMRPGAVILKQSADD